MDKYRRDGPKRRHVGAVVESFVVRRGDYATEGSPLLTLRNAGKNWCEGGN